MGMSCIVGEKLSGSRSVTDNQRRESCWASQGSHVAENGHSQGHTLVEVEHPACDAHKHGFTDGDVRSMLFKMKRAASN